VSEKRSGSFDELQKGYFALGLLVGVFIGIIIGFVRGKYLPVDFETAVWDIFLLVFGFVVGIVLNITFMKRADRHREEDKLESLQQIFTIAYGQQRKSVETLVKVAERNRVGLMRVPLEQYMPMPLAEMVDLLEYSESEWLEIREIKNFFKALLPTLCSPKTDPDLRRILLNRGATDYFYDIWAITVHKYYLVRSPPHKQIELGPEGFESEIAVFKAIERYLDETRKSRRFEYS